MKRYLSVALALSALAGLGLLLAALPGARADEKAANGQWGTIKGQVVFGGDTVPEPKKVDVNKDQDHCLSKGDIYSEDWVIKKDSKGVRWVFAWLVDPANPKKFPADKINPALKEVPKAAVEIDQPCCKFEPHALAMREGQVLNAKNSAPISHNVNWTGGVQNPGNNVILPSGQQVAIKDLKASRFPVSVTCNIHPWMKAWVRVYDHPYFAVTDADGKFEIKDAPAGDFKLVTWQESVGWGNGGKDGVPVTIKAGQTTDLGKLEIKPAP
ncbi:MAG TPA: hypothetical protein VG013_25225 [Gemmataceae bacterium]|nr:hypothetical protein [Gemmataceae bacterium]